MKGHRAEILRGRKRVIVKLGSRVLAQPSGGVDRQLLHGLADEMAQLRGRGYTFVVVSSGAILMGIQELRRKAAPRAMRVKQALAAVGQSRLMQAYEEAFERYGITVGQLLLTSEDLRDRRRFNHSRNTIEALLRMGVVPIVNENDTVAVDEIRFGDNDFLASMMVNIVNADLLVLLTTIKGLYDRDPSLGEGRLVEVVETINERIEEMAGGPGEAGSGGMTSKVMAAKRTAYRGIPTVIADGRGPGNLTRILDGEAVGTLFMPADHRMALRKHWIAFSGRPKGVLVVDGGAVRALVSGHKSLLPAGVVQVQGDFPPGSMVSCVDGQGREVARGVTCFSAEQIRLIMGRQSSEIDRILGVCPGEEVIHRDDMVISEAAGRPEPGKGECE